MCSLPAWYRSQRWANLCRSQPGCYCQPVRGTQLGCAFQLGFQSACGHHSTSASAVREHHNTEPCKLSGLYFALSDRRIRLLTQKGKPQINPLPLFFTRPSVEHTCFPSETDCIHCYPRLVCHRP